MFRILLFILCTSTVGLSAASEVIIYSVDSRGNWVTKAGYSQNKETVSNAPEKEAAQCGVKFSEVGSSKYVNCLIKAATRVTVVCVCAASLAYIVVWLGLY